MKKIDTKKPNTMIHFCNFSFLHLERNKIIQKNNANNCRANDILQNFWHAENHLFNEIINRETLVQKKSCIN